MSLLHIQNVSKTYPRGQRPAVRDVTLEVRTGSLVSLVGESGSGKTTLLRLIAGLEVLDHGTLTLDGTVMAKPGKQTPPEKRGVGLVFQHHALFPHLTVTQNITFGLKGERSKDRRQRSEHLLELVGLPGYGNRYPHELSGGERQRIALARALAPKPKLLLLDEPFSSLDTHLRESLRDETHRVLQAYGATAILVTHHTHDALAISDHIAVLHHGVLSQAGAPTEIYHAPTSAYVASLFGPCNFLPTSVAGHFSAVNIAPKEEATYKLWVRPEKLVLAQEQPNAALVGQVTHVSYAGTCRVITLQCAAPGADEFSLRINDHSAREILTGQRWAVETLV